VERLRFDEVDEEPPSEVGGEEEAERGALYVRTAIIAAKGEGENDKEKDLVELGGMTGDSIAKVHSPWKGGGRTKGIVGEASEEAADPADCDADAVWDCEEVTGTGA
jgi:hypothetical protein